MSDEQKKFDDFMGKVIKVTPEELKRRMAASDAVKRPTENQPKAPDEDGHK
ncbi:MAG TPA: hypothetical protein VHX20_06235 [Terracidiphilus sp.]|jgi:hypothetical protein|nr:hypothetical protein [Terracidiphilus sp.]